MKGTYALTWHQLKPSMTSWWAREMSVRPLVWLNCCAMSCPNVYPAPRGDIPQPHLSSGSDHNRSHIGPSCGTYHKKTSISFNCDSHPPAYTLQLMALFVLTRIFIPFNWPVKQCKVVNDGI